MKEQLADLAHRMWSGWMSWMFMKGTSKPDGTWIMPKESVERWQRQMTSEYKYLPENEKDSDRIEADKMLEILNQRFTCILERMEKLKFAHSGLSEAEDMVDICANIVKEEMK